MGISYRVKHWTSEDSYLVARQLESDKELTCENQDKLGWCTEKNHNSWPQELMVDFEDCFRLTDIRIIAHSFKIPTVVVIYAMGMRVPEVGPYCLGSIRFDPNLRSQWVACEEEHVKLNKPILCTGITLVIQGYHHNQHNVFNQAQIVNLSFEGERASGLIDQTPVPAPLPEEIETALIPGYYESISSPQRRKLPAKEKLFDYEVIMSGREGYTQSQLSEVDMALLSVGVPRNLLSEPTPKKRIRNSTAEIVKKLRKELDSAVEQEEYEAAQLWQDCIRRVIEIGVELGHVMFLKEKAKREEDYGSANTLHLKSKHLEQQINDVVQRQYHRMETPLKYDEADEDFMSSAGHSTVRSVRSGTLSPIITSARSGKSHFSLDNEDVRASTPTTPSSRASATKLPALDISSLQPSSRKGSIDGSIGTPGSRRSKSKIVNELMVDPVQSTEKQLDSESKDEPELDGKKLSDKKISEAEEKKLSDKKESEVETTKLSGKKESEPEESKVEPNSENKNLSGASSKSESTVESEGKTTETETKNQKDAKSSLEKAMTDGKNQMDKNTKPSIPNKSATPKKSMLRSRISNGPEDIVEETKCE